MVKHLKENKFTPEWSGVRFPKRLQNLYAVVDQREEQSLINDKFFLNTACATLGVYLV